MRDFRDAKSMAHDLRQALAAKRCKITVGESLEIIAHLFGVSDWNTLSALIKSPRQESDRTQAPGRVHGTHFTETCEAALLGALRAAHEGFHAESTVEHLLLVLTEAPDASAKMKELGVDPAKLREALTRSSEIAARIDDPSLVADPVPSPALQRVVQRAVLNAQASRKWNITAADLLVAILLEQQSTALRLLREHGLNQGIG